MDRQSSSAVGHRDVRFVHAGHTKQMRCACRFGMFMQERFQARQYVESLFLACW